MKLMKKYLLCLFVILGVLAACDEQIIPGMPEKKQESETTDKASQQYLIPAGAHYTTESGFKPMQGDVLRFNATFDQSAIYTTQDPANQGDINKLYGMSDCNSTHQVNSARFGWRWYKDQLEIWAYTYADSERKFQFITTVEINTKNTFEIEFANEVYIFRVNNTSIELPRACEGKANGYKLYPYFGGDEVAPHEIAIDIEDLN